MIAAMLLVLLTPVAGAQLPLQVHDGWIRPAPPEARVRAGYAVLENTGGETLQLDAVRSDAFGAIEIHEMHEVDGMMRMRALPQLQLAPGARVELRPGGLHLMLFRPLVPLLEGETVMFEFFAGGQRVGQAGFVLRAAPQ